MERLSPEMPGERMLVVSKGNTGDHAYYIAEGRYDPKSGMTFFDRHVAWVSKKEDAVLFATATKMREQMQRITTALGKWASLLHDRKDDASQNIVLTAQAMMQDARTLEDEIEGRIRCGACGAVIEHEIRYYRNGGPICSQACAIGDLRGENQ